AFQTTTGAVVFSDTNINNIRLDGSVLTIQLDSDTVITTDFFAIERIVIRDNLVGIQLLDGQYLAFDSRTISLTRRGGLSGEGPNAEPILVIRVDGQEIQTDISGWQHLRIFENSLQVVYDSGW